MDEEFEKIAKDFKYGDINQADIIDKVDSSELFTGRYLWSSLFFL